MAEDNRDLLLSVLQATGYPFIQKISRYRTTCDINVEDFLKINAFIGNFMSKFALKNGQAVFPKVYEMDRILPADRDQCCVMIECFAKKFEAGATYPKTEIISPLKRYAEKRARFLRIMCFYWRQICATTPTPSVSEPPVEEQEDGAEDSGLLSASDLEEDEEHERRPAD